MSAKECTVLKACLNDEQSEYLINQQPFGTLIYRARRDGTQEYAIKVVPLYALAQRRPHNVRIEAMILSKIGHPNIVEIRSAFYDAARERYELHLPFIDLPLSALLSNPYFSAHPAPKGLNLRLPNPFYSIHCAKVHSVLAKSIIFQILHAVGYLHNQDPPMAHRDINPSNFLITQSGVVKLVDFGVAWDPSLLGREFKIVGEDSELGNEDEWQESPHDMCCSVATGAYRAPELMYNLKQYDAVATDLWSLGVLIALFFAPLRLTLEESDSDGDSDFSNEDAREGCESGKTVTVGTLGYSLPRKLELVLADTVVSLPSRASWRREPLFDSSRGEIGLLWSIFRLMGTPTKDSWPEFPGHQEGSFVRFRDVPKQDLQPLLPHLLPTDTRPFDMIERLLAYPPQRRLSTKDALEHVWFKGRENDVDDMLPILLPAIQYPIEITNEVSTTRDLEGYGLEELLKGLVMEEYQHFEEQATPRDEWD